MKINITDEIRQEILDTLNRDTAKEYFEKLRDTEKNPITVPRRSSRTSQTSLRISASCEAEADLSARRGERK